MVAVANWFTPGIFATVNQRFKTTSSLVLGGVAAAIALALLVPAWPWAGLVPAMFLMTMLGFVGFTISRFLHGIAESHQRATLLSVKGLAFNLGYAAAGILFAQLTAHLRTTHPGADENTIQRLGIEALRIKDLVNPEAIPDEPRDEITFKKRSLPEEAQTFHAVSNFYTLNDDRDVPAEFHAAVIYAAERGLDLSAQDFYWTPETAYNLHRRVIIPFTWRGEIIGYTARGISDDVKPKYHSNYEPDYVYGVDHQRADSKFVIVSEGPFDALAIGGVAVLSNRISLRQAEIIDDLDREVIVVPDADRAGSALIDAAIEYGWTVSYPIWQKDYKDISEAVAELGQLFVLKSILAARVRGRLKIELHKKRLYN
jgi:hypothetical protein